MDHPHGAAMNTFPPTLVVERRSLNSERPSPPRGPPPPHGGGHHNHTNLTPSMPWGPREAIAYATLMEENKSLTLQNQQLVAELEQTRNDLTRIQHELLLAKTAPSLSAPNSPQLKSSNGAPLLASNELARRRLLEAEIKTLKEERDAALQLVVDMGTSLSQRPSMDDGNHVRHKSATKPATSRVVANGASLLTDPKKATNGRPPFVVGPDGATSFNAKLLLPHS